MLFILYLKINLFHFGISILESLIASIIFIFLLLIYLRPRLKISTKIGSEKDTIDNSNELYYLFKVVNMSWYSAYDIYVELNLLIPYNVKEGINYRSISLPLKRDKLNFIAPFRPKWYKKDYGQHAMIFRTKEDLSKILEKNSNILRLQVTLKHGLSGLSKVYHKSYIGTSDIIKGHFEFGNSFKIIQ